MSGYDHYKEWEDCYNPKFSDGSSIFPNRSCVGCVHEDGCKGNKETSEDGN